MAATVRAPREWEQMDPNEQYATAVEAARKQLGTENATWLEMREKQLGAAAEKEASSRFDRWELVLKRVGYALLIALAVAAVGFFIWLGLTNNTDVARDARVRAEWVTKCGVEGGVVYQLPGSTTALCVVGGKVVQVP